ncbi:hypothetical protein J2T17_003117 [Paenibacillus mucilaginosus]|uniref:hypothetical protein n=1 Tax=Paenibacillus mucilaginosus TaxID=61624 RepID=UPI003D1B96E8
MNASKDKLSEVIRDLEQAVKGLCGRQVEIRIEDTMEGDTQAPPRTFELVRAVMVPEGTHLKCYLNLTQHISIPVFADGRTCLEVEGPGGTRLISVDLQAGLRYRLRWL